MACESRVTGKYSTVSAATSIDVCRDCPQSSSAPPASGTQEECTCNAGSTGSNGGGCTHCKSGKFKTTAGAQACTDCEEGKYSGNTGNTREKMFVVSGEFQLDSGEHRTNKVPMQYWIVGPEWWPVHTMCQRCAFLG